jgi:hypothetical protein
MVRLFYGLQDKNVVDCLVCSLSLVQHSRYCIFLFDEMINYGASYSMDSLNFCLYHRRRHIYTYLFCERGAHIEFDAYVLSFSQGLSTWLTNYFIFF